MDHQSGDVERGRAADLAGGGEQTADRDRPGLPRSRKAVKRRSSALSVVIELLAIVAAAFVLAMLVQFFVVKPFTIPSVSMEPTLKIGDRVLVNRFIYHFREPHRGDVIVFNSPLNENEDLIKRVVAVAGDSVEVRDGVLWINGDAQDEPYVNEYPIVGAYPETVIQPGYVFAMGDNRNNSGDSRVFGPVPVDSILGDAFAIYWPPGRWSGL